MGCLKGASRWGLNNFLFGFYSKLLSTNHPLVPFCVGISGAAVETTFILCPFESLRTREMTHVRGSTILPTIRQEGLGIFVHGWNRIFIRQSINWLVFIVSYDVLKTIALKFNGNQPMNLFGKVLISSATGFIACMLSTPFDMLRTQIQKDNPLTLNVFRAGKLFFSRHGIRGLYSSVGTRMARSVWYSVVTLLVMDWADALPNRMKL